jgi:hypothetical protein
MSRPCALFLLLLLWLLPGQGRVSLYNADVLELARTITVGTEVEIVP